MLRYATVLKRYVCFRKQLLEHFKRAQTNMQAVWLS